MARPKGQGKTPTSGRKKGTPNKRTKHAIELAERLGVDPLEVLLHITSNNWKALGYESGETEKVLKDGGTIMVERIELKDRLGAAKEACKYVYPTRKAVDFSASESTEGNGVSSITVKFKSKE
tara:strand:- start:36226 stop:36594 length:369 start_codon:yes stop_codon:yes gene_type:complete